MPSQSTLQMTPATFVEILKRSQLIEADKLPRVLKSIASSTSADRTAEEIAKHLITAGHITEWQAGQMLKGRYRGFVLGKYLFRRPLGRGGMSVVYEAEHLVLRTRVAIKVLPKERSDAEKSVSRFLAEARAAAKLNHPNLLRVHDCDVVDGRRFMVMDLIEGSNLGEIVEHHGPLSYRSAIELLRQAAAGLEFAHENGVIHRDVKPHNFMVAKNGELKVADLGLALFQIDAPDRHTQDGNVAVLGTVDYVAPEQAWDSRKVDRRADMYSLGCTLYFMIAGRPPFGQGTLAQRLAKHQSTQPTPLRQLRSDCPAVIEQLCARMMAKKPADRFQRMREVVAICDSLIPKLGGISDLAGLANAYENPRLGVGSSSDFQGFQADFQGFQSNTEQESFSGSDTPLPSTDFGSFTSNDFFSDALAQQSAPAATFTAGAQANYWAQAKTAAEKTAKTQKAKSVDNAERKKWIMLYFGLAVASLSVILTLWRAFNPEEVEPPTTQNMRVDDEEKTIIIVTPPNN